MCCSILNNLFFTKYYSFESEHKTLFLLNMMHESEDNLKFFFIYCAKQIQPILRSVLYTLMYYVNTQCHNDLTKS